MKKDNVFVVLERDAVIHQTCSVGSEIIGRIHAGESVTPYKSAKQGPINPLPGLRNVKWYRIALEDGAQGYILGEISASNPAESGFIPEPAHYLYEYLQMVVAHQDQYLHASNNTLYALEPKFFIWDIVRPKTGREKFTAECPHCHRKFKADVCSTSYLTELRASYAKRAKKRRKVTAAVWLAVIAASAASILFLPFPADMVAVPFIFLAGPIYHMILDTTNVDKRIGSKQLGGEADVSMTPIRMSVSDAHYFHEIKSF
ncbi:MAG: hypothetical protein ACYCX2_02215 [Christensenellales bacterium]